MMMMMKGSRGNYWSVEYSTGVEMKETTDLKGKTRAMNDAKGRGIASNIMKCCSQSKIKERKT